MGVLDQKVNVQWHDFFWFKSFKLFWQNGLFLTIVLGLGPQSKIITLEEEKSVTTPHPPNEGYAFMLLCG